MVNSMRANFVIYLFLILLVFCFNSSSFANEIKSDEENVKPKIERHFVFETVPVNLEEIVKDSGKIFAGKCLKVEEIENDSESKLEVVKYTFKVTEAIKGVNKNQEKIIFKQWRPTVRGNSYEVGKKYVLFLFPESSRGLTSPVGLSQGLFDVNEKGFIRKKEIVRNRIGNKGLARNLKTGKRVAIKKDKFINTYLHNCSEMGIPMRYKEFIKAVRYLVEENNN